MVFVSACLVGRACRYDGGAKTDAELKALCDAGQALALCPEELGGLSTPRLPAEILHGDGAAVLKGKARVIDSAGRDVTAAFLKGARAVLRACRMQNVDRAILQARSPSCGCGEIYDGTFSGTKRRGDGVTAALLRESGIMVENRRPV